MKNYEIERNAQWIAAEAILLRAGVLEQCSFCGAVIDPLAGDDLEDAYKLGNYLVTNNDPLVSPFNGNRRIMTETIKEVFEDSGMDCDCSSHQDD